MPLILSIKSLIDNAILPISSFDESLILCDKSLFSARLDKYFSILSIRIIKDLSQSIKLSSKIKNVELRI